MPRSMTMDDLFSPGAQLTARASVERATLREFGRALGTFLADVQALALASLSPATEVIPFTAAVVAETWETLAREAVGRVLDPEEEQEEYAEAVAMLLDSGIPSIVYGSATAVLAEGRDLDWSRRRIGQELGEALAVDARLRVQVPDDAVTASLDVVGWSLGSVATGLAVGAATVIAARRFQRRARERAQQRALEAAPLRQRWVTRRDWKVRPTHAEADGQTVGVNDVFMVGGYSLRYPGDGWAPPHETANCRCFLVGVDAEGRDV